MSDINREALASAFLYLAARVGPHAKDNPELLATANAMLRLAAKLDPTVKKTKPFFDIAQTDWMGWLLDSRPQDARLAPQLPGALLANELYERITTP